jgi:uncharacterized protein YchJ
MKTPFVERMTVPVKPGELIFAMEVIEAVGDGNRPAELAAAYRFAQGGAALAKLIKDKHKAASLNLRSWAYSDMLHQQQIQAWSAGHKVHPALFVAAATMDMNDHGNFDPNEFFNKVEEIASQKSVEELNAAIGQERSAIGTAPGNPFVLPPRITGNDYCPCKSGKKYKKCHGIPK